MTTALAKRGDMLLTSRKDAAWFASEITKSGLCPKQFQQRPADALIAILSGAAVGWAPMQSLQYIAVIDGRPSMYGDGPTGLVWASGSVEWIKEWWELNDAQVSEPQYATLEEYPDSLAVCWQTKRKDATEPSKVYRFSVSDAKVAKLWGKRGKSGFPTPWCLYPKRMLACRARAWGLRDCYSDALQGITQAEEWQDLAPVAHEPDPIEADVIDVPAPDDTASPQQKRTLIGKVNEYVRARDLSEPMATADLIVAVAKSELGKDHIDTVGELQQVHEALLGGQYDLETGDKIPDTTDSGTEAPSDTDV
ncbi:MAG TPA: hypothetical protein VMY35_10270 [Phycisphaerae bacterium]|nr:hypothetical protein [Phycisphaerae bacterium]